MGGLLPLFFFVFLRSGEIVVPSDSSFNSAIHLCFKDVTVDSHSAPSVLTMRLKASKTEPFQKGVSLVIGSGKGSGSCCAQLYGATQFGPWSSLPVR